MTECVRFTGGIKSAVVSKKAGRWYVAITVDTDNLPHTRQSQACVGVDLGINTLAMLSTGESIENPKVHQKALKRIRFLNKELSRRKKGLSNWHKTKAKLAKAHHRVACVRNDTIHKFTTELVLNNDLIGIEDLNVKGMMRNGRLARSLADVSFGEIRRQLAYKADWYGSELVVYPRFKPSSKMCCECGAIHDMPLSKRVMDCSCGNKIDRDLNAAINIKNYAVSSTACVPINGAVIALACWMVR